MTLLRDISGPARPDANKAVAARAIGATKIYGKGDSVVKALDRVDVEFGSGEFTAIMGPSGSGKSTLMHCLAGLDELTSGQVLIGDVDLTTLNDKHLTLLRRDKIGFIFQAYNLVPTLTALENITLPMDLAGRKPDQGWLDQVVDTIGLRDRLKHRPSELSGGQQQRVAVGRALAGRPEIIFADEPTGNLDSRSGAEILDFMRRAVRELGQTIVMVTHDPGAASYADRVVFLADGRIVDEILEPTAEAVLDRMKTFGEVGAMFRLTWKGLWAHKLRFALTGLAVILGVAFMAGTQILTDTMGKTFDGIFEDANQGVDVVVRREAAVESAFEGVVRERVDSVTLDQIRGIDGVDAAAGSIEGQAALVGPDGKAEASSGFNGVIGANWVEDERLNPFSIATGNAPRAPTEAVIDQSTFDSDHHALGDTITVLGKGEPRPLTIVGTATFGDVGGLPGITLVGMTDATAQELFAEPGAYDSILVASDGSISADALSARVSAQIESGTLGDPQRFEVITGAADTANSKADLKEGLGYFNTFLLAFAYIALFVGMFIIYNTFSIVVAQRARDMAMLRAIGASRAQVVRSVVFESFAVGVVASAVGLGVGVLMSFGLRALLGAVGLEVPGGAIVIAPSTVITAFVVGTAITVASALWPAVRSSRVKPIAALRDVAIDVSGSSVARTGAGLAVLGLGVATFAAGILGAGSALALIGFGTVATIIGVFVLGPVLAIPLMHLLGAPIQRISGTTGRLARENAKRNPKRTSATASALMIGVALVGFITIMASSVKASISDTLSESLQADYIVASGSFGNGGLSPEIEADLSALPEVAAVSAVRTAPVGIGSATSQVVAVDTQVISQLADLGVTEGRIEDVTGLSVAVEDRKAKSDGLAVGDTVTMTFARTGAVELTIRALIDRPPPGSDGTVYLIGLDTYEANVTDQFDRQVFVKVADGVSPTQATAALDTVLATWPNGELQDQAAFEESIAGQIDVILNLIYGLLGLAIVIALIGIANTLALSVHERRRELGLLRAVGMTRPQVRSAIRWESVMIALMGTFLGFALAVAGSWGIVSAIEGDRPIPLVVPPMQLTVIVVLASVAGVLAALGPARRAAKLDILAAIASH